MRLVLVSLLPIMLVAQEPAPRPTPEKAAAPAAAVADPDGVKLLAVIEAGLEWLRRHQDQDGRWSASMFVVHDPKGDACTGIGKPDQDVFVTSLVIDAFSGLSATADNYPPPSAKGIDWLLTQVQEDGSIGTPSGGMRVRTTAKAANVLECAARYSKGRRVPAMAEPGLWLQRQRQEGGLWSVQGGAGATDWLGSTLSLEALTWPPTDLREPEVLQQLWQIGEGHPPHGAITGAAFLATWYLRNQEVRRRCCELLARTPPSLQTPPAQRDYLAWYFTTQAMQFEAEAQWTPWWRALVHTATSLQRQDGAHAGSWDPDDLRGRECGRVYATAAMLLGLEVVWRKQYRD